MKDKKHRSSSWELFQLFTIIWHFSANDNNVYFFLFFFL